VSRLPFGIRGNHPIRCDPVEDGHTLSTSGCAFTFPPAGRGWVLRAPLARGRAVGGSDSARRRKRAAEAGEQGLQAECHHFGWYNAGRGPPACRS
jgi:hypothetical protein